MTHYEDHTRLYGSAQGYTTCYSERAHKTLLKDFFHRTNKNLGFEEQILHHNTRRHNIVAMADVLLHSQTNLQSQTDRDSELYVTKPTRDPVKLTRMGIRFCREVKADMKELGLNVDCWRPLMTW